MLLAQPHTRDGDKRTFWRVVCTHINIHVFIEWERSEPIPNGEGQTIENEQNYMHLVCEAIWKKEGTFFPGCAFFLFFLQTEPWTQINIMRLHRIKWFKVDSGKSKHSIHVAVLRVRSLPLFCVFCSFFSRFGVRHMYVKFRLSASIDGVLKHYCRRYSTLCLYDIYICIFNGVSVWVALFARWRFLPSLVCARACWREQADECLQTVSVSSHRMVKLAGS